MSIDAALSALSTALSAVATVRRNRDALETTSASLPTITMWSTRDAIAFEQNYSEYPVRTRSLVIEYKATADDTYEATLFAAQRAISQTLEPDPDGSWLGGYALAVRDQGATFIHPQPGSNVAAIQIQAEIDYP